MGKSHGYRSGTRYAFSRGFRNHGVIPMSTYITTYRAGDVVDVKVNGSIHKGMPHKWYHGKTGVVFNVSKSAVGVIFYKVVGNRYLEKRVSIRIEHVRHSKSRQAFLERVKENARLSAEAKASGTTVNFRRLPAQPRQAVTVTLTEPETVTPVPYETYI